MGVLAYTIPKILSDDKSWSWRYKMTVEIETPEGVKTGSAVREVNIDYKAVGWSEINNKPHYTAKKKFNGEAIIVDLGERGKLFALMGNRGYTDIFNGLGRVPHYSEYDFVENLPSGDSFSFNPLKNPGGPRMVMFKDVNDPSSVKPVMIWERMKDCKDDICFYLAENNMEKLFGKGVRLKSIFVERTRDKITWKIHEILPWINEYNNKLFDGRRIHTIEAENMFLNSLGSGSFTTKKEK